MFVFLGRGQDIIDDYQSAGEPVTLGHRLRTRAPSEAIGGMTISRSLKESQRRMRTLS